MQVILSLLRILIATVALWFIALLAIAITRQVAPEMLVDMPMVSALDALGPAPWLQEHVLSPVAERVGVLFKGRSLEDALRDVVIGLATSILETLLKLTAIDMVNLLLVGIVVPIFTLGFNRLRNLSNRRLCSAHLYLVLIKSASNLLQVLDIAVKNRGKIPNDADNRARLHKLSAELDVLSDFSIAYQHVFTRRARRISVPARMFIAPVKEVVEFAVSELDRAGTGFVDLNELRFHAVMIDKGPPFYLKFSRWVAAWYGYFRGQAEAAPDRKAEAAKLKYIPLLTAAGAAIELNFQLAQRLEGRFLFVMPPNGRTLPRYIRATILWPLLRIWRKQLEFAPIAARLARADRNPLWLAAGGADRGGADLAPLLIAGGQ